MARYIIKVYDSQRGENKGEDKLPPGVHDPEPDPSQEIATDGFVLLYTDERGAPQYLGQGKVPTPDTSLLQVAALQFLSKLGGR